MYSHENNCVSTSVVQKSVQKAESKLAHFILPLAQFFFLLRNFVDTVFDSVKDTTGQAYMNNWIFKVLFLLHLPTSESTVSEGAGIDSRGEIFSHSVYVNLTGG
jgi:hypothetical protein